MDPIQETQEIESLEQETEDLEQTEPVQEAASDELTGTESVRDLTERAFKEEKAKADGVGDKGKEDGQTQEPGLEAGKTQEDKQQVKGQPGEPWLYQPPARLSAKEKETFNKMPKALRPAVARMFADHQRQFTTMSQEANKAVNESRHILEAVRPYYTTHPEIAEMGLTEGQLVAALIARHQKLSDPKTSYEDYLKLGRELGHLDDNGGLRTQENRGEKGGIPDISQHPQFIALQNQLSQITGHFERQQQSAVEQTGSQIAKELQSVIDEKDQFGRYRYPELHDPGFLVATKPLVSALPATMPYGEKLKIAWASLTGNFGQLNQTGLPANQNQQSRAINAAVSVRGRSGMQGPAANPMEVPQGASVRDLAQMAYDNLARGG